MLKKYYKMLRNVKKCQEINKIINNICKERPRNVNQVVYNKLTVHDFQLIEWTPFQLLHYQL